MKALMRRRPDRALVSRVVGLVLFPVVFWGAFARDYSSLIEEAFRGVASGPRAHVPRVEPHNASVFAQYAVLSERAVPAAVHYPLALHQQTVFAPLGREDGSYPLSEAAAGRVLSLPMHPYLSREQQVDVVAALRESVVDQPSVANH